MTVNQFPKGARYLFGNELAERWSFYGMKGVLVIFLTTYLKNEMGELAPMSKPEAVAWLHTFIAVAYVTPLLGAFLADAFLGRYRTIFSLSLIYCLGHFILAFNETRTGLLLGGGLIAMGAGGIKPNVASFLGDQVEGRPDSIRERLYSWFYVFINGGATIAYLTAEKMLTSEWLDEKNWNVKLTFGVPGVLMVIATFVLWLGYRNKHFRMVPPSGWRAFRQRILGPEARQLLVQVLPFYLFGAFFWACFDQTASTWILQAVSTFMEKDILGIPVKPSELQAFNPVLIIILAPVFSAFLYPKLRKYIPLNAVQKITAGFFLAIISFVIVALLQEKIDVQQTVSIEWQVLAYLFLTAAEILVSITLLELGYAAAPKGLRSTVMSFYALSIALGNILTAFINKWLLVGLASFSLQSGSVTQLYLGDGQYDLSNGDLVQLSGINGLELVGKDTLNNDLMGEFRVVSTADPATFTLENPDGSSVETTGGFKPDSDPDYPAKLYDYRLQGSDYFWFFTWLLAATAVLFPLVFHKRLREVNGVA